MIKYLGFVLILVLTGYSICYSQLFGQPDVINISVYPSSEKIKPGTKVDIAFEVTIDHTYHINANIPSDEFLIPSELGFEPVRDASFGRVIYPAAKMAKFAFSDKDLAVYEGSIYLLSDLTISPTYADSVVKITGSFGYQACNDQACFAPTEKKFSLEIPVAQPGEDVKPIHTKIFNKIYQEQIETRNSDAVSLTADEIKARQIVEKSLPYAIVMFFLIGLALNLTPCVYPVIPLTVSFFGGQSGRKKGSPFLHALAYVIGIAIIFAVLGLISSLAGKQWGFLFTSPWFVIIISLIILAMAASMFGAFEITVPAALMAKFGSAREGIFGAFMMGLTVGVVIAPCAAGIIIGLLGLVAKLGIVLKGTLLFFFIGLGLGLPYLILATFSGLLNRLPQSGMWMVWVRKLFGILLVGVGIYFLLPQLSRATNPLGAWLGVLGIFAGLLLGFLDHSPGYTRGFKIGRAIFGVIVLVVSIWLTETALHAKIPTVNWIKYSDQPIESLLQPGQPVFMDFYADWCAPCKELDQKTFSDPRVIKISKKFTMVKVDCTVPTPATRALMDRYHVVGMPTLIFLRPDGAEVEQFRGIGFIGPEAFQEQMDAVLNLE